MYKMRSASIHHNYLFDNNHFIKLLINSIKPTIKFTEQFAEPNFKFSFLNLLIKHEAGNIWNQNV